MSEVPGYKPALKSKTLWANLVLAALALFIPEASSYLQSNPELLTGVFTGVNVFLRFITKDKLVLS